MATAVPETILLPFAAKSGEGPTTWGQLAIWRSIKWLKADSAYFNLQRSVAVPAGLSLATVLAALRALVERHEVLRTVFPDQENCLVQSVTGQGAVPVEVHTADTAPDLPAAAALAAVLVSRPFDHATEFGLRPAVLCHQGAPRWLVLAVSHLCLDLSALRVLERELQELFAGRELPPVQWTPLHEARHQAGPGAARGTAALRHWERHLAAIPVSHFDHPPADGLEGDDPQRFLRLRLESPAGAVAATALADRCGVSTGVVLLAAAATVLAARSGRDTAALQLIAGNRFEERLRDLVATQGENALCVVELPADGTFEDAVSAAYRPSISAYRHSSYHPQRWEELYDRAALLRGARPDLAAFFNDARMGDNWEGLEQAHGPEVFRSRAALRELAERSVINFVGAWPRQDAKYFVHASYSPDSLHLNLMADTFYLPRPELEALLYAMERLLVDSVFGTVQVRDTLSPELRAARPGHWLDLDGAWCDPDRTAAAVARAAGGATVRVAPDAAGRLTAEVSGVAAELTIDQLHADTVRALEGRTDALAPQWYVVRAADASTEGSGRPAPATHPLGRTAHA